MQAEQLHSVDHYQEAIVIEQKAHKNIRFARIALCTENQNMICMHCQDFFYRDTVLTLPDTSVGFLVTAAPSTITNA